MALLAAAVGGLLVTFIKSKKRPADPDPVLSSRTPRSERSESSEAASQWLLAQATPLSKKEDGSCQLSIRSQKLPIPVVQRPLGAGALVCFYSLSGQLLVVKPLGKIWHLHPVPNIYPEGPNPSFLPTSAVFVTIKEGCHVGFKSYSANGCLLQAVQSDEPHRISNANFGSWERWTLTSRGYMNSRWGKVLDFEVKDLRCLLVEDLRRFERRHAKEKADLEELAQAHMQRQLDLQEEVSALQSASTQHDSQAGDLKQRVKELQQLCCKYKLDATQQAATVAQLEDRLSDLAEEKQATTSAFEQSARAASRAQADLLELQAKTHRERALQEKAYSREIRRLQEERADAVNAAVATCREKEAAMAAVLDHLEQSLQLQAGQLEAICAERDRLDIALQSISGQMERAPPSEASPSVTLPDRQGSPLRVLCNASHGSREAESRLRAEEGAHSPAPSDGSYQLHTEARCQAPDAPLLGQPQPVHGVSHMSFAFAQGPERLLQLLNAEPLPGLGGELSTPRIMTPRHFARAISEHGSSFSHPPVSGNESVVESFVSDVQYESF